MANNEDDPIELDPSDLVEENDDGEVTRDESFAGGAAARAGAAGTRACTGGLRSGSRARRGR